MELASVKNKRKYKIILIVICIITILTVLGITYFKTIYNNTKYIETSKRSSYIIKNYSDIQFEDYLSKKERTMIVFMATWCEHCVNESDDLNKFINDFKDYNIIVISHDENQLDMESFLKENKYNWMVVFDKDKNIRKKISPEITTIPYMVLLDMNGNLTNSHKGELTYDGFYNFYNQL